jgi:hypothetical protein
MRTCAIYGILWLVGGCRVNRIALRVTGGSEKRATVVAVINQWFGRPNYHRSARARNRYECSEPEWIDCTKGIVRHIPVQIHILCIISNRIPLFPAAQLPRPSAAAGTARTAVAVFTLGHQNHVVVRVGRA